jgi:hypothetical protein
VLVTGLGRVLRYRVNGALPTSSTSRRTGSDRLTDAAGRLHVSFYSGGRAPLDSNGADSTVHRRHLAGPTNIWFDGGDLLVADYDGDAIKRFGPDAVYQRFIGGLGNPGGVAELPDGNLLIGNGSTSVAVANSRRRLSSKTAASGAGGLMTECRGGAPVPAGNQLRRHAWRPGHQARAS